MTTDLPALPPDRSHVATERRHPGASSLDTLSTADLVGLFVDDHARVVEATRRAGPALARMIDAAVSRVMAGGRLFYFGAGTSGRLGVLDASECPPTFRSDPGMVIGIVAGGDQALRRSVEGAEDDAEGAEEALRSHRVGAADVLVGIAAGGTTPFVLGGLAWGRTLGALTALVACAAPPASAAAAIDHIIQLDTGPELLSGSTRLKAGSATKLVLNILSTALFVRLGKVHGDLMVDLRVTNAKLRDRAIRVLRTLAPELSRTAASELLDRADGHVKCAAAMHLLGVGRDEAGRRLAAAGGVLRQALARDEGDARR
ncbi:MAG TPA: N-acetylmuramic acid 6-phosphate etherase [Phycisphaerales bacterium]|nr:N-acetylmuramic acid 6-phosphate etherase [Phycisphaerales bacterium]HMP38627.1 N-acetylmuramic acid 6-phosphate etherase [Phycisphaerales bacterium]